MLHVLLLGLLLGLQHALDADHLAAVASLSTRARSLGDAARHGAAWGIGHSLTLLLFGGLLLFVQASLPPWTADLLEAGVGLMLMLLGAGVVRQLLRERVHFHTHHHGARQHFHAHSHDVHADHARDPHHHEHRRALPLRAVLVGMMHGLAGTAALLVFALGTTTSPWQGLIYIAVFGIGSIIGMSLLAVVISLPLRWSARRLTWAHNGLTLVFGLVSIALGGILLSHSAATIIAA
ncbi:MAG: sulfite exporter TauE/SafE family protein [Gammaproteobacteria bacterium]|nr:sulfite exporter TauE/SafE family protein [Gammaproteobacteria bacterium]